MFFLLSGNSPMLGRRSHFRCCKCEWQKTARGIEVFSAHLLEHVKDEIKNYGRSHCTWTSYRGGKICNVDFAALFRKWGLPTQNRYEKASVRAKKDELLQAWFNKICA